MEWSLDPSLDWSSRPGPAPPSPLETECPSGHPSTDSVSAQDHDESHPAPSSAMDTERPGGQPLIDPVFSHGRGEYCPASSPPLDTGYPDGHPPMDPLFAHGHGEPYLALSPRMDIEFPDQRMSTDRKILHDLDVKHFRKVNSLIHHEMFDELLELINIDPQPVNLMKDPLLSVVIAAKKTALAVELIKRVSHKELEDFNCNEDTPLHTAAAEGDIAVAEALLGRNKDLVELVNSKGETPLHTAAIHGNESMFWCLFYNGNMVEAPHVRSDDGSTVLHCAITANAPKLALDIARTFPQQIMSRGEAGLTPLQLIVTIPFFLRSPLVSGRLKRFLYKLIPVKVEDRVIQGTIARADEEAGRPVDRDRDEESYRCTWKSVRSKFRSPYTTILYLTNLIGNWVRSGVLVILKQVYRPVKYLEKEKKRYMAAMKLVEYLVEKTRFDFYVEGYSREPNPTVFDAMRSHSNHQYTRRDDDKMLKYILNEGDRLPSRWMEPNPTLFDAMRSHSNHQYTRRDDDKMLKYILNEGDRLPSRWMEPPLIIAAELGLHDFVHKILQVCPQSAIYLDSKGRNVMQVAIQSGHEKVVRVISEMLQGSNPVLPSCLYSMLDNKTRNTILHLAAENSPAKEGDALQLHREIVWFEMVKKIVPRELVYSRNKEEKMAHELFTNNHKTMLQVCQNKLVEMGKVCAGLVAAVVFASSFSIPTHKDNQSDKLAYTIFTHAYLIGFGCATTALVLFLSLVVTPYQERYFRRAIPRHFLLACLSFALALVGFLISFACNFVLQIYDGQEMQKMQLVKLLLELLLFPLVCIVILLFSGAKLVPSFSPYWK